MSSRPKGRGHRGNWRQRTASKASSGRHEQHWSLDNKNPEESSDNDSDTPYEPVRGAEGGLCNHHGQRGQGRGRRSEKRGMRSGKDGQQRRYRGRHRERSNKDDFDRGSSMSLTGDVINRRFKRESRSHSTNSLITGYTESIEDEEMDVNDAFKTLLSKFEGRVGNVHLLQQPTVFPALFHNIAWLKRHGNRFRVFEQNGSLEYVSVFVQNAKVCFYFNGQNGCTNTNCRFFHVCCDFVTKRCKSFSNKCNRSHNFLEKENAVLVRRLGLDGYSNTDIAKIVRCSMPEVCRKYNRGRPHDENTCPYLHVCDQNPCFRGPPCEMDHQCLSSKHNLWVLNSLQLGNLRENSIARWVLGRNRQMQSKLVLPVPDTVPSAACAAHSILDEPKAAPKSPCQVIETPDNGTFRMNKNPEKIPQTCLKKLDEQYLCEKYIWETCIEDPCPGYHGYGRVPYQWQIENILWQDIPYEANDFVEKSFCNWGSAVNVKIHTVQTAVLNLDTMTARLSTEGQEKRMRKVRRLSTRSYCQGQGSLSHLTSWCWYWLDDGHTWKTFQSDRTQYTLEKKYLHGQTEYYFEHRMFHYMLSFTDMTQLNLETGTERQVLRRPIYVSVRDVKEKKERSHPDLVQQIPKAIYTVPSHWTPLDLVQPFELVKLHPTAKMFVEVERSFHSTLERTRYPISNIFQVQNPSMWDKHCSHKRSMEHTADREGLSSMVDERMLYHGTDSEEVVRGICVNGFDHRVCGKNGTVYGRGAYFAVKSSYSNGYTGGARKRYMFRARVLVGQHTTGTSDLTRPPCRKGHTLYDSCVDNIRNPSIFVLFDQNQSYPDFLIEYEDLHAPVRVPTQLSVKRIRAPPVPPQGRGTVLTGQSTTLNKPPIPRKSDSKCVVM